MRSMTGFGSAIRETPHGRLTVELRSVNNRFLELNFRLGSTFIHMESELRNRLRSRLVRGKVDVTLRFDASDDFNAGARVNKTLVRTLLAELKDASGGQEIRPEGLLSVPGVLVGQTHDEHLKELAAPILELADEAAAALVEQREREGEATRSILSGHQTAMVELAGRIAAGRGDVVARYRERLSQRIAELLGPNSPPLDPGRLEQEVAVFADKADIAEECARLEAHLDELSRLLATNGEAVGRKLEFLSQEMLREVNTTGSKCRDLDIARDVLALKNELESLREQIANVE